MAAANPSRRYRRATAADIPALVDLVQSAYRGESSREGWTTEADLLDGQRIDPGTMAETLARPDSHVVILEEHGRLLACAHIEKHDGAACAFGMFAVRPGEQRRGVGDALLRECERVARQELGCTRMDMTVIAQRTDLVPWYERRGYRDTGRRKPFPYGDTRFGLPKRDDLQFVVLDKPLA